MSRSGQSAPFTATIPPYWQASGSNGESRGTLALCREAGNRPELAWNCCDYADALRERAAPEDRTRAVALLDKSLAISSELGMRPLKERVMRNGFKVYDSDTHITASAEDLEPYLASAIRELLPELD